MLLYTIFDFAYLVVVVLAWCYCAAKFHQYSKKEYFTKRGVMLSGAFLYLTGINTIFLVPLVFLSAQTNILVEFDNFNVRRVWVNSIIIVTEVIAESSAFILALRLILQFMNIGRSQDSVDWKRQIDPNYNSFALKYFHIFGNPKKLFIIFVINTILRFLFVIFVSIILSFFIPITNENYQTKQFLICNVVILIDILFVFSIAIYLGIRIGKFIDFWQIRNEFKYFVFTQLFSTILISILFGIAYFFDIEMRSVAWGLLLIYVIWCIACWYITIIWVIKVNESKNKEQANNNSNDKHRVITLVEILTDAQEYNDFMKHVQKRFCNENFLFITIMVQWQNYLIENGYCCNNQSMDDANNIRLVTFEGNKVELASTIPMSPIIFNLTNNNTDINNSIEIEEESNSFDKFAPCFVSIYKQYIEMDIAPLEINISFQIRNNIKQFYDNLITRNENGLTLNEKEFWYIWQQLVDASYQIMENLTPILVGYSKNLHQCNQEIEI